MAELVLGIYNVSSVQRVLDFIKTVYAFNTGVPAIIKPIGAAAQIGIPEAYKISYKLGKPLIILPDIPDLLEALNIREIYMITRKGKEIRSNEILTSTNDKAIIVNGSDTDFTRQELQYGLAIKPYNIPLELPPQTIIALILYSYSK